MMVLVSLCRIRSMGSGLYDGQSGQSYSASLAALPLGRLPDLQANRTAARTVLFLVVLRACWSASRGSWRRSSWIFGSRSSFTLAVERDGKPGEDGKRATDLIDSVAWRGTAEFLCKFFGKGRMVVATGRLQTRTWKDKHDQTRKETELNATNLYFGDTKKL